jgi:GntR family transcriptional regulator
MRSKATDLSESVLSAALEQPSNNRKLPNIGEPFNPYGMFNGIWVPDSLLRCPHISASAKLLYGRLTRYAGSDGHCFPSVETLAVELGMTARQVQRLLGQLCDANFLRRNYHFWPNGSQTSNAYVFLYHASLVPAKVVDTEQAGSAEPVGRRAQVPGDKNVTGGVTTSPPLEDSPLNRLGDSSRGSRPTGQTIRPAAEAERYPLSAARFREFFPRTTTSVIVRILRAILAECPDGTDEDIAAAVNVEPNQNSPGLWVCTMPDRVRNVILRRIAATPSVLKCQQCRDAGMVWDDENRTSWCPADCEAAVVHRRARPDFVEEWNSQFAGPASNHGDIPPIVGPKPPSRETGLAAQREAVE